jgi:Tol biopolymer transport system component
MLVPALGGQEREVTRFKGSAWSGTACLSGGNRLVISACSEGGAPCYLLAVPLDRGTPKVLTQPPGRLTDVYPAVSPDGKTLAFARVGDANNTVNQLFVLQVDANQNPVGPPRKLRPELLAMGGIAWAPDGKSLFVSSLRNGEGRIGRVFLPGGETEPFPSGAAGVNRISIRVRGNAQFHKIQV